MPILFNLPSGIIYPVKDGLIYDQMRQLIQGVGCSIFLLHRLTHALINLPSYQMRSFPLASVLV